jgi:hypothetical protein
MTLVCMYDIVCCAMGIMCIFSIVTFSLALQISLIITIIPSPSGRLLVCRVVLDFRGRNQIITLVKGSPSLPWVSRLAVNSVEHVV